jgi:hypothetical protein
MVDLSVVIVSWNVRSLLRRCLASIYNSVALPTAGGEPHGTLDVEVIVVDNASSDDSVDMVRQTFPQVHLVANSTNLGFPTANNQGIRRAGGRYVLLLNPDTEVVGDALGQMISFADEHPDVGMVGPQLLNADGTVQSSRRRFPTLATAMVESTWLQLAVTSLGSLPLSRLLTTPIRRLLDRYYVADRPDGVVQDVDWVTGAAMFSRREAIDDVGEMDEAYFMYSEELDWCRRFREAGWRIVYFPEAQIIHHVGKSSEQVTVARHIHFQTSKVRYFRKHHDPLRGEILRWYLLACYVFQSGVEGAKWLVGHRRPLRAQRLAAYRQVLASRLRQERQV